MVAPLAKSSHNSTSLTSVAGVEPGRATGGPLGPRGPLGSLSAAVGRLDRHHLSNTWCTKPSVDASDTKNAVLPVVEFHLDYLTIAVHVGSPAEVGEGLERLKSIVGRLWSRFTPGDAAWCDLGPGGFWASRHQGPPGVTILAPRAPDAAYLWLELKGEAFTWLSSSDVLTLESELALARLDGAISRWKCRRIDLAFDHLAISPLQMRAWHDQGATRSKVNKRLQHEWMENEQGRTFYLKSGKNSPERKLRLYDRRGYNRLELELRDDYAEQCFADLLGLSVEAWPAHAAGRLRSLVDFVKPDSADRLSRCDLLPEWADLVSGVDPLRLRPRVKPEISSTPAGKMNLNLQRQARTLSVLRRAVGNDQDFLRIIDHVINRYEKQTQPLQPRAKNAGPDAVKIESLRAWIYHVDGFTSENDTAFTAAIDQLGGVDDVPF